MAARASASRRSATAIDRDKSYSLAEAVDLIKSAPSPKFDESVDLAINLGVDPRHADQMVRGAIVLPHGIGKSTRVLVFAKGGKENEARERRRRLRGRRGPRQEDPGRGLARLRARDRDARHDERGGTARKGARPARPDAQPEARHGDDGRRRPPCARPEGGQGRVPGRQGRHHPRRRRQELVRRAEARRQRHRADRRDHAGQARVGQGHLPEEDHASPRRWVRASGSIRRACAAAQAA